MSKVLKQFYEIERIVSLSDKARQMRLAAENWGYEWQILIATVMSARTLDETTIKVGEELFKKYGSVEKLAAAKLEDVETLIKSVNFFKNKAKSIINCCKTLVEKYNGKVPHDIEKLVELSGVGRKTANIFLSEVGQDAIGVDTHVYYISRKLGWTNSKKPEDVEKDLKEIFPQNMWNKVNPILVKFGKIYTSRKEKDRILEEIKKQ